MSSAKRIWVMPSLSRSFFMRLGKSKGSSDLAGTTFLILCYMPVFKPHVKLYRSVWIFSNNIACAIKTHGEVETAKAHVKLLGHGMKIRVMLGRSLSPYESRVVE